MAINNKTLKNFQLLCYSIKILLVDVTTTYNLTVTDGNKCGSLNDPRVTIMVTPVPKSLNEASRFLYKRHKENKEIEDKYSRQN